MTAPKRDSGNGRWATVHGVRALQEERHHHQLGEPLSEATALAIRDAVLEYAVDRGGLENCNHVELSLISDMALCDLIRDHVLAEAIRRQTLFGADGQLLPMFKSLATYMNTKRLHAMALGLRPEPADRLPSLQDYLASRAAAAETHAAPAVDAQQPVAADAAGAAERGEEPH
jgi:hypothetical protein